MTHPRKMVEENLMYALWYVKSEALYNHYIREAIKWMDVCDDMNLD